MIRIRNQLDVDNNVPCPLGFPAIDPRQPCIVVIELNAFLLCPVQPVTEAL